MLGKITQCLHISVYSREEYKKTDFGYIGNTCKQNTSQC